VCYSVVARLVSPPAALPDPNGNNDSGYAASNVEETALQATYNSSTPRRRPAAQQDDRQKVNAFPIKVIATDILIFMLMLVFWVVRLRGLVG
jgi:hypothetical protein